MPPTPVSSTLDSLTLSVRIERPHDTVHAALAEPWTWPRWASGLASGLRQEGETWIAEGPGGAAVIRFSEPNPFGVADHWVIPAGGPEVYVPLRVIRSGDGAEVLLTLQRQPSMTDADFARDADWVRRDLQALKALIET